jgi:hypothetical protein
MRTGPRCFLKTDGPWLSDPAGAQDCLLAGGHRSALPMDGWRRQQDHPCSPHHLTRSRIRHSIPGGELLRDAIDARNRTMAVLGKHVLDCPW